MNKYERKSLHFQSQSWLYAHINELAVVFAMLVIVWPVYDRSKLQWQAFVISMDHARGIHAEKQLSKVGIKANMVRPFKPSSQVVQDFMAMNNASGVKNSKIASLTLTHDAIMKRIAGEKREKWMFVFEDDVTFVNMSKQIFREVIHHIHENYPSEGFLYLGICDPYWFGDKADVHGYQIRRGVGQCSHSYAVTRNFARIVFPRIMYDAQNMSSIFLDIHETDTWMHYDVILKWHFLKVNVKPLIVGSNILWGDPAKKWYGLSYQAYHIFGTSIQNDL